MFKHNTGIFCAHLKIATKCPVRSIWECPVRSAKTVLAMKELILEIYKKHIILMPGMSAIIVEGFIKI